MCRPSADRFWRQLLWGPVTMGVNPLLPSLYAGTAPTKVQSTDIFHTQDRNLTDKIRFVFEAPAPKQPEYSQQLQPIENETSAVFQLLLEEQQQIKTSNANTSNVSPHEGAADAYAKADSVGQYARPQNFVLSIL